MRYSISLTGVVQGVGFRPFVKRLADRFELPGIAYNTAGGLAVEVESAKPDQVNEFVRALVGEAPTAAKIEGWSIAELARSPIYEGFQIVASAQRDQDFTLISADLATCSDCLRELQTPGDRRFQYAFANCTNCGPRYSIILRTPYDRVNTTMRSFPLCAECTVEYQKVSDRRFHAEPIGCPRCGPELSSTIAEAIGWLEQGLIVAVKGLGGFQLACDALNPLAVKRLRLRKRLNQKPFALMMRNVGIVEQHCILSDHERTLLENAAAPIVLLRLRHLLQLRQQSPLAAAIAPGLLEIGVMLPNTPLHNLLFASSLSCLVMTSGNISEEPIVVHNAEAAKRLAPLADRTLTHNRDIFMRVDDSIARVFDGAPRILRRARGYAPEAIALARDMKEVLAVGAELKNTFCLTKGRFAITSQHIGDLENFETLCFFEETLSNLKALYQANPILIAHDLHPDYLGTRWAQRCSEPKLGVQHHHAHVVSCMAENGLDQQTLGVAFDGSGYGSDGQVWGGEFLLCDYKSFTRAAHLRYVPFAGGDRAVRDPWRMAAAHLFDAFGDGYRRLELPCWNAAQPSIWKVVDWMIRSSSLFTSSCGRLFDAAASICGVSQQSTYEGESAILLEVAAGPANDEVYDFDLNTAVNPWQIDTRRLVAQLAFASASGQSAARVSRCFHNSIARMISLVCRKLREANGVNKLCLSGGTFQNVTLLTHVVELLRADGFEVFLHSKVPPNDGGLSLGQAVIAASFLEGK